eukprot:GILJ01033498.1.p1 GENE.GILJ01033498.1~~GILJ01033498.1.p1  ORF type:complete len:108 (+),score=4.98 GILJ01033498.1:3-326(+)
MVQPPLPSSSASQPSRYIVGSITVRPTLRDMAQRVVKMWIFENSRQVRGLHNSGHKSLDRTINIKNFFPALVNIFVVNVLGFLTYSKKSHCVSPFYIKVKHSLSIVT